MNINTTIQILILILIIVTGLKYYLDLKSNVRTKLKNIETKVNQIAPGTNIVKITLTDSNTINLLCLNNQGKWFKVNVQDQKKLEFSALSINEVVTILTKIS